MSCPDLKATRALAMKRLPQRAEASLPKRLSKHCFDKDHAEAGPHKRKGIQSIRTHLGVARAAAKGISGLKECAKIKD